MRWLLLLLFSGDLCSRQCNTRAQSTAIDFARAGNCSNHERLRAARVRARSCTGSLRPIDANRVLAILLFGHLEIHKLQVDDDLKNDDDSANYKLMMMYEK